MKMILVTQEESGQRMDKLLARYMRKAPKSFLYKMLRKKNITLNNHRAEGNELLCPGDQIKLFLSDETYEKFGGICMELSVLSPNSRDSKGNGGQKDDQKHKTGQKKVKDSHQVPILVPGVRPPVILYQDANILLFHKPADMLSQKASVEDVSLVEYLNAYLLAAGSMTQEQMQLVHPAICNRLDRNTSGIVIAGISLAGLQTMNQLLKERCIRKYYRCIVCGSMSGEAHLRGYLCKDGRTNTVTVMKEAPAKQKENAKPIETAYRVLAAAKDLSLLEVHLLTGRSHQIRAHLASIGHPILGDRKYGDAAMNRSYAASHGVSAQLLHAYRLEFPQIEGNLSYLSGRIFCDPMPGLFTQLVPFDEVTCRLHD